MQYDAEIIRMGPEARLAGARRKVMVQKFARHAALRWQAARDPGWCFRSDRVPSTFRFAALAARRPCPRRRRADFLGDLFGLFGLEIHRHLDPVALDKDPDHPGARRADLQDLRVMSLSLLMPMACLWFGVAIGIS